MIVNYDIVILTDDHHENYDQQHWRTQQTRHEDQLLIDALNNRGLKTAYVSWSNPHFDWRQAKAIMFRSTWDYYYRFEAFLAWLNRIKSILIMVNPLATILWNANKKYLFDLQSFGVPIVDSICLEKNQQVQLPQLFDELCADEIIIKPQISGSALHTFRINRKNIEGVYNQLDKLISKQAFIVQPFQKNILTMGEISMMVINGKFTHAVQKQTKQGDFRVQSDHGGTVQLYAASKQEIFFAEQVVAACHTIPFYARVDVIRDNNDQLALMELELIEPEMFFRFDQSAVFLLADSLVKYLTDVQRPLHKS